MGKRAAGRSGRPPPTAAARQCDDAPIPPTTPARAALACWGSHSNRDVGERHGPVPAHPESPERVDAVVTRLKGRRDLWRSLLRAPCRRATDEELRLCHDAAHLEGLKRLAALAAEDAAQKPRFVPSHGPVCMGGPCQEVREGSGEGDTFLTPGSLEAARLAVGGLLHLVDDALSEESRPRAGLALCRPPGHHASASRSSGFCLLNNVAVAAAYARARAPSRFSTRTPGCSSSARIATTGRVFIPPPVRPER